MVAERSSQDCFTQSAGLLYAVRKIAKRSPQHCFTQSAGLLSAVEVTLHFNFLDLHFLPDPSTGSGILFGLRDPFRAQGSFSGLGILFGLRDPFRTQGSWAD